MKQAPGIDAYIAKSPDFAKQKRNLQVPAYFMAALKKNKQALSAFEKFSPSHKREYVKWITEAKREETRQRRIATAVERIVKG
jgi:uncharacterized protein YdeI (YjbR/CyaY-like superfamily)